MNSLYITADQIGTPTGGGVVTYHEAEALKEFGPYQVWDRDFLLRGMSRPIAPDPWHWDELALYALDQYVRTNGFPKLAHFYSGTFSKTVKRLKEGGAKVTYTVAAHAVEDSRAEHHKLGLPYDYPHLTDPNLFKGYIAGYLAADAVVCPSQHSADTVKDYPGYAGQRVEVIPHGVTIPYELTAPFPERFTVGYLGAVGPDKGLIYLLQAWKKLNYQDGSVLVLAGSQSQSRFVKSLIEHCRLVWETIDRSVVHDFRSSSRVQLVGWVDKVADFYNQISLYVQPSPTEGFGIEVLEAMAHGRPVLCSTGAGAADVVPMGDMIFPRRDVDALAERIDEAKREWMLPLRGSLCRRTAENYTWDKVQNLYKDLWRSLL